MELCDIGHEQVCFETPRCPACEIKDSMLIKIEELQMRLDKETE